jgi:hypothetical protein
MSIKLGKKTAWLMLVLTVLVAGAAVAIPVWLIQPFAPQTPGTVELSFILKNWSPWLTIAAAAAAIAMAVVIWRASSRWFGKAALIVPIFFVFVFAWFARQNHFEWMFNPLGQADFAGIAETDFVADDDMVLAVNINGDAVAFPVRQMGYHHIAQAVVGGTPITATY